MADQGIEILIIQDSDLELGTQKYFQFCVYSPNWDSLMPHFNRKLSESWAYLVAQTVTNPPAKWETWVWSLSWEDPLEEGMAVHSSILAWRIPWTVAHHSSLHGVSPGKNTEVGCHALLQGIFSTQGSNPGLLHCKQILYHLSHQGSPLCS